MNLILATETSVSAANSNLLEGLAKFGAPGFLIGTLAFFALSWFLTRLLIRSEKEPEATKQKEEASPQEKAGHHNDAAVHKIKPTPTRA